YSSPVGWLELTSDGQALTKIGFLGKEGGDEFENSRTPPDDILSKMIRQLDAYFIGERKSFDIPLNPAGTAFQRLVWAELRRIPWGKTVSYADIARAIGHPTSYRAVGAANGRNPIPIVVPCHRVIGADGSLTGFGGGLEIKQWLLQHESTSSND